MLTSCLEWFGIFLTSYIVIFFAQQINFGFDILLVILGGIG